MDALVPTLALDAIAAVSPWWTHTRRVRGRGHGEPFAPMTADAPPAAGDLDEVTRTVASARGVEGFNSEFH